MAVATCCIEVQTEPGLEEQLVKAEAVEEAAKEEEQEDVEDNEDEEEEVGGRSEKVTKVERMERAKQEIERIVEGLERTKRGPAVSCEICKMKYKKIYKLKFHLMKHHIKEISERFRTEKEPGKKVLYEFFTAMKFIETDFLDSAR